MKTPKVLKAAIAYNRAGLNVVPVVLDGSKAPALKWDRFKSEPQTEAELIEMFSAGDVGIGIIGGKVSGGLEILDFEIVSAFEEWADLIENEMAPGLLATLPQVKTPNGRHVYFRSSASHGNQVLARSLQKIEGKNGNVVIETRGEGGYVIAPPSPAGVHASGRLYERDGVPISKVPTITEEQRKVLLDTARAMSAVPDKEDTRKPSSAETDPNKPGTDFNARGSWPQILEPHGWRQLRTNSRGVTYWQRPGKSGRGISATTGYCQNGDLLVFSSNAAPLDAGRRFSKFTAFGRLNHGGDFREAARALDAMGYGKRTPMRATGTDGAPAKQPQRPPLVAVEELTSYSLDRMLADNKGAITLPHVVRGLLAIRDGDPSAWVEIEDVIKRHRVLTHFKKSIRKARPAAARAKPELVAAMVRGRDSGRKIYVTTDLETMNNEAMLALIDSGAEIYQRDGRLVHVVNTASAGGRAAPTIQDIGEERLRELLASAAEWVKERIDNDGDLVEVPVPPPKDTARAIMQRGAWPNVRRVSSVIEVPAVRPDGTIVQEEGYDHATCVIYRPLATVRVPASPDLEDARMAVDELMHAVADFPFAESYHRAAWLAAVLTPFARHAFDGPTPLFLIDANTRGSGKTLLARTAGHITCGRIVSMMSPLDDNSEERKRITSIALSGDRLAIIDNATSLGGEAMNSALTNTRWSDRILGESRRVEADLLATWIATGNNTSLDGDMCRRVLQIRLRSQEERPEDRENFKHPDLGAWLAAEWPKLAGAALTILRAWFLAGRPLVDGVKPWGSFEGWARIVPHAVAWCGAGNPTADRSSLVNSNDTERESSVALLYAMRDCFGRGLVTVREIIQRASCGGPEDKTLRESILDFCPSRTRDLPTVRSLGNKLAKMRDRIHAGMRLDGSQKDRVGLVLWSVVVLNEPELPLAEALPF